MALLGNLEEAERDELADRWRGVIVMNAPLYKLPMRNQKPAVVCRAVQHVLMFDPVHDQGRGAAQDAQSRARDHLAAVPDVTLTDLAAALRLADRAAHSLASHERVPPFARQGPSADRKPSRAC